ncbi:uncharacterized protein LOC118646158 isoform X2 [Monomorium pharaonis]|nr:uncharacterized protein LOC118646158 isoform X2 [Monomorium pharaonis]
MASLQQQMVPVAQSTAAPLPQPKAPLREIEVKDEINDWEEYEVEGERAGERGEGRGGRGRGFLNKNQVNNWVRRAIQKEKKKWYAERGYMYPHTYQHNYPPPAYHPAYHIFQPSCRCRRRRCRCHQHPPRICPDTVVTTTVIRICRKNIYVCLK